MFTDITLEDSSIEIDQKLSALDVGER